MRSRRPRGDHYGNLMSMSKTPDFDQKEPLTLLGIPVRLDATLCEPDEIWIEGPRGDAVRIWPAPEEDPLDA